ncbi:CBS domain-containing protein [Roseomonas sp. AR75]|uniref:CBS domain-containing protein n=1 Tax=Roseomonas sp. AR75 TaxID=2562311 RepID=UPI0010C011D7|nr:CBS domain-containing protein [Roseomonas sp. AR75]
MGVSVAASPPTHCFTITPEEPAAEAARLIAASRLGAVPVQDRTGRVVGLVSERDIVRVVATRAQGLRGLAVEEVMSRDAATIRPETTAGDALALMQQRDLRHLPLCGADGRLIGVVGLGDLMRG